MSNARELSEIASAITVDSSKNISTVGSVTTPSLISNNTFGFKNRIINGAMVIDQRNAGAEVNPAVSGAYYLDRWQANSGASGKFKIGQNSGAIATPAGFNKYLGCTSLSAYTVGAGESFQIRQGIEGFNISDLNWGTANAKPVTLSFQVYSSLTGTFGGSLRNGAFNYSYPFTYSIPVANTWTQISITIAGPTAGTWTSDNTLGVQVGFSLGTGSTFSGTAGTWSANNYISATGATSVVGTSGATFYITGVQLEVGSSATGFEYRQYQQELALCQRYFYQFIGPASGFNYVGIASGVLLTTTIARTTLIHKVPMRTSPTITPSATTTISAQAGTTSSTVNAITAYSGNESSLIDWTLNVAGTAGQGAAIFSILNTGYLTLSAEL